MKDFLSASIWMTLLCAVWLNLDLGDLTWQDLLLGVWILGAAFCCYLLVLGIMEFNGRRVGRQRALRNAQK